MPVGGEPEAARLARVPGEGLGRHDARGVVQEEFDGVFAVVRVEGVGEVAGDVEAVEVGDGRHGVRGGVG